MNQEEYDLIESLKECKETWDGDCSQCMAKFICDSIKLESD